VCAVHWWLQQHDHKQWPHHAILYASIAPLQVMGEPGVQRYPSALLNMHTCKETLDLLP
jgi:hypothetical protein